MKFVFQDKRYGTYLAGGRHDWSSDVRDATVFTATIGHGNTLTFTPEPPEWGYDIDKWNDLRLVPVSVRTNVIAGD